MKNVKFLSLLMCLALLAVLCVSAFAADDPYTYTVRIYAGQRGTVDGGEVVEYTDLPYGTEILFDMGRAEADNTDKYYVRGIRESGKDNNTVAAPRILVKEDMDYVVAYGISGDTVPLTIHYVERDTGRQLAADKTYYGNVGDRPIVSYLYIENYLPQAYNITGTLREGGNEWTFQYTRIVEATPTPAPTATPASTSGGTTGGTTGGSTVIYVTPTPNAGTTTPAEQPAAQTAAPAQTPAPANTPAQVNPTVITPAPGTAQTANQGNTQTQVNPTTVTPGPGAPADANGQQTQTGTEPVVITPGPLPEVEEILDMDAPLAEYNGGASAEASEAPTDTPEPTETPVPTDTPEPTPVPVSGPGRFNRSTAIIGGVAAAIIAIGGGTWIHLIRTRKSDDEEDEN